MHHLKGLIGPKGKTLLLILFGLVSTGLSGCQPAHHDINPIPITLSSDFDNQLSYKSSNANINTHLFGNQHLSQRQTKIETTVS